MSKKIRLITTITLIIFLLIVGCGFKGNTGQEQIEMAVSSTPTTTAEPTQDKSFLITGDGLVSPAWACYTKQDGQVMIFWEDLPMPNSNEDGYMITLNGEIESLKSPQDTNYLVVDDDVLPESISIVPFYMTINGQSVGLQFGIHSSPKLEQCGNRQETSNLVIPTPKPSKQDATGFYAEEDSTEAKQFAKGISSVCAIEYPQRYFPDAVELVWEDFNVPPFDETGVYMEAVYQTPRKPGEAKILFEDLFRDGYFVYPEGVSFSSEIYTTSIKTLEISRNQNRVILLDGIKNLTHFSIHPFYIEQQPWGFFSGPQKIGMEVYNTPIAKCPNLEAEPLPMQNEQNGDYYYFSDIVDKKPLPVKYICKVNDQQVRFPDFNYYPEEESGYSFKFSLSTGTTLVTIVERHDGKYYFPEIPAETQKISIQPFFRASADPATGENRFTSFADDIWLDFAELPACVP